MLAPFSAGHETNANGRLIMLHVACGTSWRRECYGKYLTADVDAGEEHELRLGLGLGRRNCSQVISIELQCKTRT